MNLTVLVATYEWPQALDAVLRGLADQSDARFDVVVCDDGSGCATAALVEAWQQRFGDRLAHVPQADEGYRLAGRGTSAPSQLGATTSSSPTATLSRGAISSVRCGVPLCRAGSSRASASSSARSSPGACSAGQLPIHRWSLPRWLLERGGVRPLRALTPRDRRRPGRGRLPEFVPHADGYGFLLGVTARTSTARTATTHVTRAGEPRTSTWRSVCAGSGCAAAGRGRRGRSSISGTRPGSSARRRTSGVWPRRSRGARRGRRWPARARAQLRA